MPGRVSMKSLQSRDRIQRGSYTSGSSSTHSRLKRPPVSVDAEHRVVIHTVKQCVKDIQGYHELRRDVDVEDCAQTAHDIMEYSHEKASGDDVVDFLKVVQAKEYVFEGAIKERKAYETLVNFAENVEKYAVSFPIIIEVMKNCITDHLSKYCVSFRDEATADDVISTREYEEKIRDYKRTLEEKLKDLEDNSDRFEKLSKPFVEKCVLGMTEVNALIVESCKGVNAIRDIIRQWIARDKAYPKKLGDEIYHGNEHRNKLRAQLTVITKKTEALYPTKRKHDRIRAHLVDKLTDQRREKRRILNSKATLDELVEKSERELEQVRSDAERTHQRIAQRKSNSPKYLDSLWANQDRLKTEDTKIEHRLESFKRQLSRMDKDIVLLDDVISKLEGELAEVDQLSSACRHVSAHIGSAWKDLYNHLIFSPTRDRNRKQKDIDAVYTSCLRRDQTMSEQAWQSLVKWRVFNRQRRVENNLQGLAKALRKVEKFKLAQHIEQNYLNHQDN
ncbi:hypothetical protein CAPTEDRAFT_189306 [Capitella teleta]|uniref:Death domain-containing protein n=1 Tax=Capitella teleta TaxID=283909 RepID=R7UTG2_CAPTE|nr:hypothetical protein CAPTEDRAFT_189306 [Capitella teleta]|eukprot:ELU06671.1 hypothetical protein CAPTEDRAFT_189306 [Capitella teleta]